MRLPRFPLLPEAAEPLTELAAIAAGSVVTKAMPAAEPLTVDGMVKRAAPVLPF